jgi:CheY-like chemotaxis protein
MKRRAATIDLAPWPYLYGPRVLIEHPDPNEALDLASAIRRAGCSVYICRGPARTGDPPTRCPLHKLEPCVAVEGADVVVTALDLADEDGVGVVRGLRTRYPDKPLVVAATVSQTLELGDVLEGCTVVPVDEGPDVVVAAVCKALA